MVNIMRTALGQTVMQIKNFIIQPPFKYSKLMANDRTTNNCLYNHFRGIRWDDGNSTLTDVEEYLKMYIKNTQNPTVYVKGLEKLESVKTLIGKETCILNLDGFNCSNIAQVINNTQEYLCKF
ncbi:hypothetical protein GQX74_009451 [Glossina fuscipes]|nr:hypothetical protein GQX74_009451 [Glossina fuscipes]